jgi:hypothetical protein
MCAILYYKTLNISYAFSILVCLAKIRKLFIRLLAEDISEHVQITAHKFGAVICNVPMCNGKFYDWP